MSQRRRRPQVAPLPLGCRCRSRSHVELAAPDSPVNVGDPVVAMGYPHDPNQMVTESTNIEGGHKYEMKQDKPLLTLTDGIVSRITPGIGQTEDLTITHPMMGEMIETTINASGRGNSGGPVFNSDGKVIGLFTYGISVGGGNFANETRVVPIKYGWELLQMQ
jgi:serine protease Do